MDETKQYLNKEGLRTVLTGISTAMARQKEAIMTEVKKLQPTECDCLSDWQKDYLARQEEAERSAKFAVSLSATGNNTEFTGQTTPITLTASTKYDGAAVQAQIAPTTSNLTDVTFDASGKGVYNAPAPTTSNGKVALTFGIKATYTDDLGSIEKTASATVTRYAPIKFLSKSEPVTGAEIAAATQKQVKSSAAGEYSIELTPDEYVWVCVPSFMAIKSFTSGGFAVPMQTGFIIPVPIGSTTVDYMCYRTTGAPKSSPMILTLS